MFSESIALSPVPQEYVWLAEYYKGHVSEFDLETGKENSFYDIEKEKLVRFGLIGSGNKFWFECTDGTFNLNGKRVDIQYRADDTVYKLTGSGIRQDDIITYKRAVSESNAGQSGTLTNRILSFNFGFKSEMILNNIAFHFKPIVTLSQETGKVMMAVSLMADADLDGKIEFVNGDRVIDAYEAPLKTGLAGTLGWELN